MHSLKTLYQLSQGFVGAEESQVKALPEDVEGDAPFGLRLINLASVIYSQFSIDAVRESGRRCSARLYTSFFLFGGLVVKIS